MNDLQDWAAQKQSRSDSSILPICINTHGQYTTPTVQNGHTKYCKYFRGFLNLRLLDFARNSRKLMYHEYFRFYSTWSTHMIYIRVFLSLQEYFDNNDYNGDNSHSNNYNNDIYYSNDDNNMNDNSNDIDNNINKNYNNNTGETQYITRSLVP